MELGTSVTGAFTAASCQNLAGFRIAEPYSVALSRQTAYAITLTPTVRSALVPLTMGGAAYALPPADTAVTAIVVARAGAAGFLVTAPTVVTGSYRVTTSLDPDPLRLCVPTVVTFGVTFNSGLTNRCPSRDIRLLAPLAPLQLLRVSVGFASRPVTVELRSVATGAVLQSATANNGRPTAEIVYLNGPSAQAVFIRLTGNGGASDLIPVTIAP